MGSDNSAATGEQSDAGDQSDYENLNIIELTRTADHLRATQGMDQAIRLFDIWVKHNPDHPLLYAVLFNYGVILTDAGDLAAARACFEQAIALNADFMPPHINLGRLFERIGAADKAVLQWAAVAGRLSQLDGQAITYKTMALNQMARVLEEKNQDEAAENQLRLSLEIDVNQREAIQHLIALRQRQCEWPVVAPWDRVERKTLMSGLSPLSACTLADDPLMQLASNYHYNKCDVGLPAPGHVAPQRVPGEPRQPGPLKIGYLSSDLRVHAIGFLMAEVFELHDPAAVEVTVYYSGIRADDHIQGRIKAAAGNWVDITQLDDAAAAKQIADDGIQILVDVNGYTREGRLKMVALRPAPVIVNWLGYPGSMASPYHHYIIADDWIIPEEHEIYYSEKVARLPCYQPNDRKRIIASEMPTRRDAGLPEKAMVYCCFNGLQKVNRFTFERWLTILERVPDSVLWLMESSKATQDRLTEIARQKGFDESRLIFAGKAANAFHLARYPLADLFLDTLPYGAHTTASDALWMGVPVLTLSGLAFASRVCGSLVRSAGLAELICTSPAEYVDRAVALGRDKALRQRYRDQLRASRDRCVLFDTPNLVCTLEGLYGQMWRDFENGQRPVPDLANLDVYLEIAAEEDYDALEMQSVEDYREWWREKLARRHALRPIAPDRRLWTDECADGAPIRLG